MNEIDGRRKDWNDDLIPYLTLKFNINIRQKKKLFFEKKNPLIKFIFLSSIGAVDRDKKDNCSKELNENSVAVPTTDYGKSKLLIEEFLEKSILETISIRPSLVIGEQMRSNSHFSVFSKKIIKKKYFHILIGLEKCQY